MVDEIKRALEIAETIPFRYLIQHMGVGGEEYDERKMDAAFSSLEEITAVRPPARRGGAAREHPQRVLERRDAWSRFLRHDALKLDFCFDVGHANMNEGVEQAFETMKDRIRSTHVHDNDGKSDSHCSRSCRRAARIDWKQDDAAAALAAGAVSAAAGAEGSRRTSRNPFDDAQADLRED